MNIISLDIIDNDTINISERTYEDGTVEYSYLEYGYNGDDLTIQKIDKAKDITNIIQIFGNDSEGIGGNGVLFITSDGNSLPYFRINRETIY